MIKTYIYVGKNLCTCTKEESGGDEWYFQDPRSYFEYGRFLEFTEEIEHETFIANEDALFQMYDFNGLIERLLKINEGKL